MSVSEKQLAANRTNARKSTGPRTAKGKAKVAKNSIKHGIFASVRALPAVESEDDWKRHLAGTLDALQPEGHVERMLAERVAQQLWRLGRVVRFEREAIALQQEKVPEDYREKKRFGVARYDEPDNLEDAQGAVEAERETGEWLDRILELEADQSLADDCAGYELVRVVAQAAGVVIDEEDSPSLPGVPDEVYADEWGGWTAGIVRGCFKWIASTAQGDESVEELVANARRETRVRQYRATWALDAMVRELERMRRQRLLPSQPALDKVAKYEAHLERGLYKALHELQRMQAMRLGAAPAPAAVDVDMSINDSRNGNCTG